MVGPRQYKDRLYQLLAEIAGAMASPHRLELLDLLLQAPRTVEELAAEAGLTRANTSQHLQWLRRARLAQRQRQGTHVEYRLASPAVGRLWLERRLAELPEGQSIVAYCRGPYCVYADEALAILAQHGRIGRRLEEGVAEWEASGLPVIRAAAL